MHFLNTVCKIYHLKKFFFFRPRCNRGLCDYKIAFYNIAILSQMQLIVQPYLKEDHSVGVPVINTGISVTTTHYANLIP